MVTAKISLKELAKELTLNNITDVILLQAKDKIWKNTFSDIEDRNEFYKNIEHMKNLLIDKLDKTKVFFLVSNVFNFDDSANKNIESLIELVSENKEIKRKYLKFNKESLDLLVTAKLINLRKDKEDVLLSSTNDLKELIEEFEDEDGLYDFKEINYRLIIELTNRLFLENLDQNYFK